MKKILKEKSDYTWFNKIEKVFDEWIDIKQKNNKLLKGLKENQAPFQSQWFLKDS
jgi:hypothetical protein